MMKTWHVIINPLALGKKRMKLWKKVLNDMEEQDCNFKEYYTQKPKDAIDLTKEIIENGAKNIIALGGDGTLNELVNGIMISNIDKSEIILAHIPMGTGNDWAKTHKISRKKDAILKIFQNGTIVNHDVGLVQSLENKFDQRYFINIAGMGFDAAIIKKVSETKRLKFGNGLVYIKTLLSILSKHRASEVEIEIDNENIKTNMYSIAAGICKYNGNGMMQVPMANFNDGLIDLVVINDITKAEIISQIPNLFSGKHVKHRKISTYKTKELSVKSKDIIYTEVEGELLGSGDVKISVCNEQLKVLV
ncbi:MAG: diacylglycerol kinase family lipid kinase [Bacteroidales bacterium]|nr:diacylglycerol kinase family lipid kinase [Bacteroidales bacterium]